MGFYGSQSVLKIFIFFWTTGCHVSQGLNTQNENSLGSSFFFYQQSTYPRDCKEIQENCPSYNSTGVFMIKPDGYLDPFEVYCDSADGSGGWTVIQRRVDGSIGFNRSWDSYKSGFGFLSHEFWLGNQKLSFLTNQQRYQLMVEMTTLSDSLIRITYDNYRISDEFDNYKLVSVGQYDGSTDAITFCGANMICGDCDNACQRTCEAPNECHNVDCTESIACVCPDGFFLKGSECEPPGECGCYDTVDQIIIPEGEFYVNTGCTRKGTCTNQQISFDEGYQCSPNAVCEERGSIRQCYCNDPYTGDGENCTNDSSYKDCQEIYENDPTTNSGVYMIKPAGWSGSPFEVFCNMSNGGGWTVFQRRVNGSENFNVPWANYKAGFGNIRHEFWLGNEKIHLLTNQKTYEIRIDLVNKDDDAYHANFNSFRISDENDNYRFSVIGTYSGTADERNPPTGSTFSAGHGGDFTANDQDNDAWSAGNCASSYGGAWWYSTHCTIDCAGCDTCTGRGGYCSGSSSLNRGYSALQWSFLPGTNSLQYTEMKIRPV